MKRPIRSSTNAAFTLIELLVVITIIGILATLAPSAINGVLEKANQTKAVNGCRNVISALKLYASEHDGAFPSGDTAADAFSKLLPQEEGSQGYIPGKKDFIVKGSAWTKATDNAGNTDMKKLAANENHWAYMAGLDDAGGARWPLVFDGPSSPDGKYSNKKGEKGGVWSGKTAIVGRLGGDVAAEALTNLSVKSDGQDNILRPTETWATGGKVSMPY
ncbi:MAG: hypothetical protein RLZZ142_998 [Verrucomicrobiota bacterium]|jgi:prepilin-type N-terminal cleavage/methylation domain-containing protein